MDPMTSSTDHEPTGALATDAIDPQRMLESIVSELEILVQDAAPGFGSDLVRLHGALLAYNVGGRAELLPTARLGWSARTWRERGVVREARRIVDQGAGDVSIAVGIATEQIERNLHLIDPELAARAA
jgi:hypothetical protein